jgi:hypothetical protein
VVEVGVPIDGYTTTYTNDKNTNKDCNSLSTTNGGSATCTITNNDQPGSLRVYKHVDPSHGGSKLASDFMMHVRGPAGYSRDFHGDEAGTLLTELSAGTYTVTEDNVAPYEPDYQLDCPTGSVTIANGGQATCHITNAVHDFTREFYKTADATPEITYSWTIRKTGRTSVTLLPAQQISEIYDVTVTPTTAVKTTVRGTITFINGLTYEIPVPSFKDVMTLDVNGPIYPPVSCPAHPAPLQPNEEIDCTYSTVLPAGSKALENVVIAPINGDDFSSNIKTVDYLPPTKVHDCIWVSDDLAGGTQTKVCETGTTLPYTVPLGPYDNCGSNKVTNTACFYYIPDDVTIPAGCSPLPITIDVTGCGCTLTQGYWKTHSSHGPAPYDKTWGLLDANKDGKFQGSDEPFFIPPNKQTWYQVFQTPPSGGNVYYQLAYQYMGAKMNILKGAASPQKVTDAINWAETSFFNLYTPTQVGDKKFDKKIRDQANSYASLLDQYNSGTIGPGHCKE